MPLLLLLVLLCSLVSPGWAQGPRSTTAINTLQNDTTTGTTINLLAKIVPGPNASGKLVLAATTDVAIDLYVIIANAGTSGNAVYVVTGDTSCVFDATAASGVAGQYVVASTTTAGRCHAQASPPTNGIVVGKMVDDSTTVGQLSRMVALNQAYIPGAPGSGSGTVNTGLNKALACYAGNGTTVDDCVQIGTTGKYPRSNGTDFILSTLGASGVGPCTNQVVTALNADAIPTCATITSAMTDASLAQTGGDLTAPNLVNGAAAAFALKGDLRPTALSGDVNDYNPTNLSTAAALYLDGGAALRQITGLQGGADGRLMEVCNIGSTAALTLKDQSTSSTATNRFALNGDLSLQPGACMGLIYDSTAQRWRGMATAIPDALALRSCIISVGDPGANSAPLADDNDTPDACANDFGRPWKILSFACKADGGSPTATPILTGGTATSIVTGAVTCGTSWTAGTLNGTPTLQSFSVDGVTCGSPPCTLAANITAAGGTAKFITLKFVGTLQR